MRVWTKAVWQMTDDGLEFLPEESVSFEYDGPVAQAGGGATTTTQQTTVPEFLRPFLGQSSAVAGGTLRRLRQASQGDVAANLTPAQQLAHRLAIARAGGAGGFFPTAQNTLLQAAQGQGLDFLPGMAMDEFGNAIDAEFLPAQSRQALIDLGLGGSLPGTDTLRRTASGDFLHGGEGFDAAVEAAVRAATPGILSTFGSAGVGGGTGALSQAAIGTAAVDAFARQFANERQNQLTAADQLGRLGLAGRGQQLGAIGQLANIGQGEQGLGIDAASQLAQFAQSERGRQLIAAGLLPEIASADINLLSAIGGQQQAQAQREIDLPMEAQRRLLQSVLAGPGAFSPLFGQTQTQETESNPFNSILGAGLGIASLFTGGGALGGLLGGGGGVSGLLGGLPSMSVGELMGTDNPFDFFNSPIGGF